MRVHRFSSLEHYALHVDPIWQALPEEVRGHSWAPRSGCWWGEPRRAVESREPGPVIVASFADANTMARRPLVHVEHGAGQAYSACPELAGHPGYSDGGGLARVVLFIVPGEEVAARRRRRYPRAEVAAVGCPRLDRWHADPFMADLRLNLSNDLPPEGPRERRVAITFHWHHRRCPELQSTLPHYSEALGPLVERLRADGVSVLGHAHPKAASAVVPVWEALGVPYTPHLADVFDRADLLVADNSSCLPEFASLGRPVVWLNGPSYRRDVEQGGRFWTWPAGQVQVDEPDDLYDGIVRALADPPEVAAAREAMVASIYAHRDGRASERAADAIVAALERWA